MSAMQPIPPYRTVEQTLHERLHATRLSARPFDAIAYAIDYKALKRPELRGLVLVRTGRLERGNLSRQHYIDILEEDYIRKATFKFLDLPAELRNEIYSLLLVLRDKQPRSPRAQFCYPAILRVSRLVHKEASSVLYGENTATILLYGYWRRGPGPKYPLTPNRADPSWWRNIEAVVLQANFLLGEPDIILQHDRSHQRIIPNLPAKFLQFKSFSITIGMVGRHNLENYKARLVNVSHALHALASSVRTIDGLKTLKIEVKWDVAPEEMTKRDAMLREALWPLTLITNCEKMTFSGIGQQLADSLEPVYSSERVQDDPIMYMRELVATREDLIEHAVKLKLAEKAPEEEVGLVRQQFKSHERDRIEKSVLYGFEFVSAESLVTMRKEIQQLERDVDGDLCKRVAQWAFSKESASGTD